MKIPLVDLKRQYQSIQKEIDKAIQNVINDSAFILGKYTKKFEDSFAQYCSARYCVGVNSGTDALLLSYLALGIKKGDEVITTPCTFFATTEPLGFVGAKPVFVDILSDTYLIDPSKIISAITNKTKAIVAVHLYGQMANMKEIMNIARKYKLRVIEDCAQAHGAEQNGKKAGTFGDMGIYSFYPGKNLGGYGDAGCVVTNNKKYADFVKKFRDHGRSSKYEHKYEAFNTRMDGIQAAILTTKLKHLNKWVEQRRKIAKKYNKLLPTTVIAPHEAINNKHAYHLYVIRTDRRDKLQKGLELKGIQTGIHYPIPLHLQKAYSYLNFKRGMFPVCEEVTRQVLSLPIFPELKDEEIKYIIGAIKESLLF